MVIYKMMTFHDGSVTPPGITVSVCEKVPFWLGRSEPSTHHIAENSGGLPAHPCLPSSCTPEGQQGLPAAPAAAWLNLVNLLCELLIITEAFQN